MTTRTHSQRAMEAALQAIGAPNERTAAILIFFAAARHLGEILGDAETAGELAYMMADELATDGRAIGGDR